MSIFKKSSYIYTDKMKYYFFFMIEWMKKKNKKRTISDFLKSRGISSVSVYGYGDIGELLCEELSQDGIDIVSVIDRNKRDGNYCFLTPDDDIPQCDAIVVTPFLEIETIEGFLKSKVDYPVISIEDIVYDC